MKNNQNIVIVLLCISAALLGAMLISSLNTNTAYAGFTGMSKGPLTIVPYNALQNRDVICVLDSGTKKMVAYSVDAQRNRIESMGAVDLESWFARD